jgi:ubiquinone/menaquinone biosynthesis C-methylase UbiE
MTPRTSTNRAPGSAAAAGSVRPRDSTYALKLSDDELERYRMMAARARVEEHALWSAAGIVSGAQVADVGCGPGAMLVALAEVVGPTGHVIGVDADPTAVGAARVAFAAARLRAAIAPGTVRRGRADATGVPPGSVDAVVLRHVLAHNGGSEQRILDHLATLVRPGGRVYLLDVDLTSTGTAQGPPVTGELHDRYVRWHQSRGNDPRVGRRLGELTRRAGLTVLEQHSWTVRNALPPGMRGPAWAARDELVRAGLATVADVRRWDAAFAKLDRSPERPESSVTVFAVVGRRPA